MKNIFFIIITLTVTWSFMLGLHSCKDSNCDTPALFTVTPVSDVLEADGRSTTQVILTPPAGFTDQVELTISAGVFILNNQYPSNRIVISSGTLAGGNYTLLIRAGGVADGNVRILVRSACGVIGTRSMHYITPLTNGYSRARFIVTVDSSHAVRDPYVTVLVAADSTLIGQTVRFETDYTGATISPNATTLIDQYGRSGKVTIKVPALIPNRIINIIANISGGVRIDTPIGFFSVAALVNTVNNSALSLSSAGIQADGRTPVTVTFTSGIPQLAGTPISFTSLHGKFITGNGNFNPLTLTLDNSGSVITHYLPDSNYIGTNDIIASFYGGHTVTTPLTVTAPPSDIIQRLLDAGSPTITLMNTPVLSNKVDAATIHFQTIQELAGHNVTFTSFSGGRFLNSNYMISMPLDNNGATNAYFVPDSGYVGDNHIRITYYSSSYYLDTIVRSR